MSTNQKTAWDFPMIMEERESLFAADCYTPEEAADEQGFTLDEVEIPRLISQDFKKPLSSAV